MQSRYFIAVIICTLFAGLLSSLSARGQDYEIPRKAYTATGIPDSLTKDANSVIRYSYDEIRLKGPGKAVVRHHSLLTILNEKGDKQAIFEYLYNRKYDTYSSLEIKAYDQTGKLIKKYHKSDMYDGAAGSDETLVTDDRFLGLKHAVTNYPETLEESYEEDISSFITMPEWEIQHTIEQSVQHSKFKIIIDTSATAGFKYECKNIKLNPKMGSEGALLTYTWEVENLKPIKDEENAERWRQIPSLKYTTGAFNCFGYPGYLGSWKNFGDWIKGLNADVGKLSDARIAEIKKMTDTIKTDKDKAKFLYKYMQQSMRYVSIQLGIGGFKPFAATFVDEKKYGDCKALSNYMHALLAAVNIQSYHALIRAGENAEPADFDFPHNDFNHEILCIPFKNDTVWLECTSNKTPFGVLGPFTENRTALLITNEGGRLVNTPKSTAKSNQFNSEVHIELQPDGSARAKVKIASTGEYRFEYLELAAAKLDEQKEYWQRDLDMKQPSNFDYEPGKDTLYTKYIDLNLDYDKFVDVMAGDKQFYRPMVFPLWRFTAPITEKRVNDFYLDFPLQKSCVTTIDLPKGFEVESLPANASLKFNYGTYDLSYAYNKDKNQVVGTAKFVLNSAVIPASKYTEMQEYFDGVAKAQNKKLVIKKKA